MIDGECYAVLPRLSIIFRRENHNSFLGYAPHFLRADFAYCSDDDFPCISWAPRLRAPATTHFFTILPRRPYSLLITSLAMLLLLQLLNQLIFAFSPLIADDAKPSSHYNISIPDFAEDISFRPWRCQ